MVGRDDPRCRPGFAVIVNLLNFMVDRPAPVLCVDAFQPCLWVAPDDVNRQGSILSIWFIGKDST